MQLAPTFEFPHELQRTQQKARWLAWGTLIYLTSVGVILYLVLGSSQAMKAAWLEDLLSMIPPAVFLLSDYIAPRAPNRKFPFGYHRAPSVAFLAAAGALLILGLWLLYDSAIGLIRMERPTIGAITTFGETFWLGWLMIAALLYSGIPPVFIGRMQIANGRRLHDKVLYADGSMRKADWLTASAAIAGILGIGLGFWWADAVAAIIISLDILHDGWVHFSTAMGDLMDRQPTTVEGKPSDLPRRVDEVVRGLDWVLDSEVRMREQGHLLVAEVFVVPKRLEDLPDRIDEAVGRLRQLDWRIGNVSITPVTELDRSEYSDET